MDDRNICKLMEMISRKRGTEGKRRRARLWERARGRAPEQKQRAGLSLTRSREYRFRCKRIGRCGEE